MPTTINGVGTHYYGKRNLEKEQAQCEYCRAQVELQSYETGLYFVFFYVPLLPLGKKQILNFCPACHRHHVMPLRKYVEWKEQAIESSTERLAEKMEDPGVALEHLQTLTAFKQWEDAKQLAPAIEQTHADDIEVILMLGSWYEHYGEPEDADRCFERAYRMDPDHPVAKRAHVVGLIQGQQLEEAEKLLEFFRPPSEYHNPTLFFMLGQRYQSNHQHAEAIRVFDQIAADSSVLAVSKELRKAVLKSEKASGLKSENVRQPRFFQKPWFATSIVATIVALIIAWMILN